MQKIIDRILRTVKAFGEGMSFNELSEQLDVERELLHSIVKSLAKMNCLIVVESNFDMYLFSVDGFSVIQGKDISTEDNDHIFFVILNKKDEWENHENLTYAEAKTIYEDSKKTHDNIELSAWRLGGGSIVLESWRIK